MIYYIMPKNMINYGKTVMYHFVCNDDKIKNTYVGHTTDFTRRKSQHKSNCKNEKAKEYNFKLYKTIRENGGWDNWSIVPLEEFPCETKLQAAIREQVWINKLKSDMNTNITYIDNFTEYRAKHNKKYYDSHQEYFIEYRKKKLNVVADADNEAVETEGLAATENVITV